MCSYFVSAKTGDNVTTTFYRVAADLAGIDLSNQEIEVVRKIVRAEIVNIRPATLPGERQKRKRLPPNALSCRARASRLTSNTLKRHPDCLPCVLDCLLFPGLVLSETQQ